MNVQSQSTAEVQYSPLYFLAALGAGGMVVTFFMYLMFWVPHTGQPVPVFEDIWAYAGTASLTGQIAVAAALLGIAVFSALHIYLIIWNLRQLGNFRKSPSHEVLLSTNAETQLMAAPLALAMAVNVGFIAGLVFVPQLWSVVEYLFPLAIIAFVAIGIYAFQLLARFLGRVMADGGFSSSANNSFAQLLPAFALSMVAVGLAAPSAMSEVKWIVGASTVLSTFFITASVIMAVVATVMAVQSIMKNGTALEAAPTLMVVVPIITVLTIALLRQDHGLHTAFEVHASAGETFAFLSQMLSIQILFAMLGLLVLKRQDYVGTFLSDAGKRSAGSYALICPGVALSVMIHFWVNKGLVATGLIAKFGTAYWAFTTPALILQVAMIILLVRLHGLHFAKSKIASGVMPAE